jgi:hypothetical protein
MTKTLSGEIRRPAMQNDRQSLGQQAEYNRQYHRWYNRVKSFSTIKCKRGLLITNHSYDRHRRSSRTALPETSKKSKMKQKKFYRRAESLDFVEEVFTHCF